MLRKFDIDNKELKQKCIDEVLARLDEIGDDGPGMLAAQDIIDIVTQNYGPAIYNKAIVDVKKLLEVKFDDFSAEIDLMEQH